jgi:hypothetical protein
MSDALKVALVRSGFTAVVMAGAGFFGQLASGGSLRAAEVAAGVAFFGALALRGGIEGLIDNQAAAKP